eukprot:2455268-Prymnesium_polylepis.1
MARLARLARLTRWLDGSMARLARLARWLTADGSPRLPRACQTTTAIPTDDGLQLIASTQASAPLDGPSN